MTTAVDISGLANHGTYRGAVVASPGLLAGDDDKAALFDGGSGWVDCNAVINDLAGKDPVTLCAWARPDDVAFAMALAVNRAASTWNRFLLQWEGASGFGHWALNSYLSGSGANQLTTEPGNPHAVGSSMFVVGVFGTTAQKLYVDGSLVASTTYATVAPIADDRFSIGQDFDGLTATSDHWNGVLDDVVVFDRALTDAEVADLHAAGTTSGFLQAAMSLAPVGYWRLNDLGTGWLVGMVGIG